MKKSLEYITALSSDELTKMLTTRKSQYSADELAVAKREARARGLNINSTIDTSYLNKDNIMSDGERTTADYIREELGDDVVIPTNNDNNPLALRHAFDSDMDTTTFVMWIQAFVPLFAGAFVGSGMADSIGLYFLNKFLVVCIFDALLGIIDLILLFKKGYNIKKLAFWAVWLPPVYMYMRMRMLREKNFQYLVWIICFLILVIM